jgi:signal transduction histidine kinase
MFRRRLQGALAVLALAAVVQGAVAWWAVDVASLNVLRGRVASDVLAGFLELSAAKQRLRAWVSQAVLGGSADPLVRDRLYSDMAGTMVRIESLAEQARALARESGESPSVYAERDAALRVLNGNLQEMRDAIEDLPPAGATPVSRAEAFARVQQVFDTSQGRDLRTVLAENIAREQFAVTREREAANRSLSLVRGVAFGATFTLACAAVAFALYFAGALRRPLDELRAGAEALQRGDLAHRIPDLGPGEFGGLARTVNALAGEIAQSRQREAEARLRLEGVVQSRTAELQQALHTVQLIDARRRQLFADISHELRTPTTAIRGEAEITLRGREKPVEEYRTALARIAEAAQHLGAVIDDLLAIARTDLDALSLRRETVEVESVLDEALGQARALAREHGIVVEHVQAGAAADARVSGDPQRLRQLFMVVLDNAVRYSHEGGRIRVRSAVLGGVADPPARWQLEVQDEGIGIAPEDLPRVFDRHFRGSDARARRPDGSGLGLHIAQALARAHGGEVAVTSTPGQGTRLQLNVPLLEADAPPTASAA